MMFKKLPIVYTKSSTDAQNYMDFKEGMSATFDTEPFKQEEMVLDTYVNVADLISITLRPLVTSEGTVIQTQSVLEHGENFLREHWVVDMDIESLLEVLTNKDENILDV